MAARPEAKALNFILTQYLPDLTHQMRKHSVVAAFNSAQEKLGRGTCSSAAASTWLKENRKKHAISPHVICVWNTKNRQSVIGKY